MSLWLNVVRFVPVWYSVALSTIFAIFSKFSLNNLCKERSAATYTQQECPSGRLMQIIEQGRQMPTRYRLCRCTIITTSTDWWSSGRQDEFSIGKIGQEAETNYLSARFWATLSSIRNYLWDRSWELIGTPRPVLSFRHRPRATANPVDSRYHFLSGIYNKYTLGQSIWKLKTWVLGVRKPPVCSTPHLDHRWHPQFLFCMESCLAVLHHCISMCVSSILPASCPDHL